MAKSKGRPARYATPYIVMRASKKTFTARVLPKGQLVHCENLERLLQHLAYKLPKLRKSQAMEVGLSEFTAKTIRTFGPAED